MPDEEAVAVVVEGVEVVGVHELWLSWALSEGGEREDVATASQK